MLAIRITFASFSVSVAMSMPNSLAGPASGVPPWSARRALKAASTSASLTD